MLWPSSRGFAFAGGTDFLPLDLQTGSAAANGSPEINVHLVFEIRSGLRAPAFRLLLPLRKDSGENVTEITPSAALGTLTLPRACLVGLEIRKIESAEVEGNALLFVCVATAIAPARCGFRSSRIYLVRVKAELVIDLALLIVTENVVRLGDFLELLLGLFVVRIYVGVVLARKLAKGFANLIRRCGLLDSEQSVIIFLLSIRHVVCVASNCLLIGHRI